MEKDLSKATPDGVSCVNDPAELNGPIAFVLDVQVCQYYYTNRQETRLTIAQSRLKETSEEYRRFLDAFRKYQEGTTSAASTADKELKRSISRDEIRSLLKGHEDLYSEFESFFPAS